MVDLALIKGNVAKMASQGAPEADIDGYISQAGASVDDVKNFKPNAVPKTDSALAGLKYGAITEPIDVVGSGLATIASGGPNMGASFLDNLKYAKDDSLAKVGAAATDNPNTFLAGQIGGNIATTAIPATEAVTGLAKLGQLAKLPAAASILEGTGAVGTLGRGALEGAASSSMLGQDPRYGAAGGAAGNVVAKGLGMLAKPIADISPMRQGMVDSLENAGIDLTPGQATGSKALQNTEAAFANLPFTAGRQKAIAETQNGKFTESVLKQAGLSGNTADEGALNQIATNLGNKFDDIASRTTVPVRGNQDLTDSLTAIRQKYQTGLDPDQKSVVYDYLNSIGQKNDLSGEAYQQARSSLGAKAAGTNDSYLKGALMDIRSALDDAAKTHMTADDAVEWDKANKGYRNFLVIQDAMKQNAGISNEGNIPPAALLSAARKATGNKFAQGSGDLNAIARAGYNVLKSAVPDSGTAQRALYQNLLSGGAGAGGGYVLSGGDPTTALTMGAIGLGLPYAAQSAYYSKPIAAYLKNGVPIASDVLNSSTANTIGSLVGSGLAQRGKK